jgi:hypothetical protein
MKKVGWFLAGAISLLAIQALAVTFVLARAHGWSAREKPAGVEQWIAWPARDAALPAGARSQGNPTPKTEEVLADARAHWADHLRLMPR